MDNLINLLIEADRTLEKISVRGDDVYTMIRVRNLLKTAYDAAKKEAEKDVPES